MVTVALKGDGGGGGGVLLSVYRRNKTFNSACADYSTSQLVFYVLDNMAEFEGCVYKLAIIIIIMHFGIIIVA